MIGSNCCLSGDAGKLLLRLTIGGLMLFHGVNKLTSGIEGVTAMVTAQGMPPAVAYGVYVGEVLAPLLVVIGLFTRLSAAVMAFNMVVATLLAHPGDLLKLNEYGGWAVELQALYLFGAASIALLGAGHWSVDAAKSGKAAASDD
ncbi:MAG: DoxX family protein [Planctomycetota bacterium]